MEELSEAEQNINLINNLSNNTEDKGRIGQLTPDIIANWRKFDTEEIKGFWTVKIHQLVKCAKGIHKLVSLVECMKCGYNYGKIADGRLLYCCYGYGPEKEKGERYGVKKENISLMEEVKNKLQELQLENEKDTKVIMRILFKHFPRDKMRDVFGVLEKIIQRKNNE